MAPSSVADCCAVSSPDCQRRSPLMQPAQTARSFHPYVADLVPVLGLTLFGTPTPGLCQ